jgi:hypothetical protein
MARGQTGVRAKAFSSLQLPFIQRAELFLRTPLYYFNANSVIDVKIKKYKNTLFVWMFNIFRILSLIPNSFMRESRCCL